jgi:Flp pilus assembly protein TadG
LARNVSSLRSARARQAQGGAAAVEFAVLLPLLVVLTFGIIEFGLVFNTQLSLTGAAREGARVMAIHNDETAARDATLASASMNPAPTVTVAPAPCTRGDEVTVRATREFTIRIPFFDGPTLNLAGVGVMRCGG